MNQQVLINALQAMSQENTQLLLNNHLLRAELDLVKAELSALLENQAQDEPTTK